MVRKLSKRLKLTTMQTTLSRRPKPTAPNPLNLIRNGTLMINHRQTSKNLLILCIRPKPHQKTTNSTLLNTEEVTNREF